MIKFKMFSVICGLAAAILLTWAQSGAAGDLNPGSGPATAGSQMYTLTDIYNRLHLGTAGTKAVTFMRPGAGPVDGQGKTLDEVMAMTPAVDDTNGAAVANVVVGKTFWGLTTAGWGQNTGTAAPAAVPKTGQTTTVPIDPAPAGSDGALQKGVAWPNPRFTVGVTAGVDVGTVKDNLTGLIWLKQANYNNTTGTTGTATWANALTFCNSLQSGQCGLDDGSTSGQWRLPNRKELDSLVDLRYASPPLCNTVGTGQWSEGTPFTSVQSNYYWSSSTLSSNVISAWFVRMDYGYATYIDKGSTFYVWPVRGGQ